MADAVPDSTHELPDITHELPDITHELVAEFGDDLPATLIRSTILAAAGLPPAYPDEPDLRQRAREDVSALAAARRRSGSA